MEDRENFRALAAMFALGKIAYYTPPENEEFAAQEATRIAKTCVRLADALLDELEPQEGLVALKKRKKNVPE